MFIIYKNGQMLRNAIDTIFQLYIIIQQDISMTLSDCQNITKYAKMKAKKQHTCKINAAWNTEGVSMKKDWLQD